MQRGFTIIELIIVIAIVGILAAIAIPMYSSYQNSLKVRTSLSEMEANLRNMQTAAKATGQTQTATFTTGAISYTLSTQPGTPIKLEGGVTITSTSRTVQYNPSYSPNEVTLLDEAGQQMTTTCYIYLGLGNASGYLTITPNTGKIEINY